MCNNQAVRSTILDRLTERWRRVRPPGPFGGFDRQTDCRRTSEDVEEIAAWLGAEFSEEQLEASGIVKRAADGQWKLASSLGRPGGVVVPLREKEGESPFEILTPTGTLVGRDVPVVSTLRDYRTSKWLVKADRRLFVCASTEQIPVFWSVFLPATTSAGLMDLNGTQLQELSQKLGWGEPLASKNTTREMGPVNLTLVNWQVESLSTVQCAEIRPVAQFLARAERCLDIDMSRCAVWSPAERELEDIRFCLERKDLDRATEALLSSADTSSYFLSAHEDPDFQPRRQPEDVVEALAEIERCQQQFDGGPASEKLLSQAQATYEDFIESDLVGPFVDEFVQSGDPLKANLGMVTAESLRLLHRQAPFVRQNISKLVRAPSSPSDQKDVSEQLKQWERQITNFTRLAKELRR